MRRLVSEGVAVTAVVHKPDQTAVVEGYGAKPVVDDLADASAFDELVSACRGKDAVLHAAFSACLLVGRESSSTQTNRRGAGHEGRAVRECVARVFPSPAPS